MDQSQTQDPSLQTPQDASTQQAQEPDQDEGASQPTSVIEIAIYPNGKITVEQESGSSEDQEEAGGGEDAEQGGSQPTEVRDATEAASLVKQMIDQATQTTDQQAAQNKQEQAQGYAGQ
jgi:hypothetical protein